MRLILLRTWIFISLITGASQVFLLAGPDTQPPMGMPSSCTPPSDPPANPEDGQDDDSPAGN